MALDGKYTQLSGENAMTKTDVLMGVSPVRNRMHCTSTFAMDCGFDQRPDLQARVNSTREAEAPIIALGTPEAAPLVIFCGRRKGRSRRHSTYLVRRHAAACPEEARFRRPRV